MKKIFKLFFSLTMIATMIVSCSPDDFSLGAKDVKASDLVEGLSYTITHDATNPNIVYLESKMDVGYTVLWNHPQGRSQAQKVTLKIPFPGTYEVEFGVETRGGIVYAAEKATFTIDAFHAPFVDNELWTLLSGGVGQSKTWVLDLTAEGVCKYFSGPLFFYGTDDSWDNVTDGKEPTGPDSWSWAADWAGNGSWLFGSTGAADYGSMTFDLIDGAHVKVEHLVMGGTDNGLYMLDTDNHTMSLTNAVIIHDPDRDAIVSNWRNIKILSLTENSMQLGVVRDQDPNEGPCLLVYNFISKEYADNWVPSDQPDPEPVLPAGWQDDISRTVITSVKWVLSDKNPLDWCDLSGSRLNEFNTPDDYPDWLGTPDPSVYGGFSMTLNSQDNTCEFVTPDGTTVNCEYALDEKGIYTFSETVPSFAVIGWASFAADDNNQLRIMSIEKDATGKVTGMWLGAKDSSKPEYFAYHLVPQAGSSTEDPLAAWKSALAGKSFTPNLNAFCDWLNFDLTGGWTTPNSFGTDFSSNGWVWTQKTESICKSATLSFAVSGGDLIATLVQDVYDADGALVQAAKSVTGKVTINTTNSTLTFAFDLVDYTGSPASWAPSNNAKGAGYSTPLGEKEWLFVSHPAIGNNLSNIKEKGLWLGAVSNSVALGDDKDEILAYWWSLK